MSDAPQPRAPAPHEGLGALVALLGTWRGRGRGDYPTIEPFDFLERVRFDHVGKPVLSYVQGTRHATGGHPMHAESGYLRPSGPDRAEWVLAQPTGIVEVLEGTMEQDPSDPAGGVVLDLVSTTVGTSSSAKRVRSTRRRYAVVGDRLTYDFWMAYGDLPVTHHLHAELERVDEAADERDA